MKISSPQNYTSRYNTYVYLINKGMNVCEVYHITVLGRESVAYIFVLLK